MVTSSNSHRAASESSPGIGQFACHKLAIARIYSVDSRVFVTLNGNTVPAATPRPRFDESILDSPFPGTEPQPRIPREAFE